MFGKSSLGGNVGRAINRDGKLIGRMFGGQGHLSGVVVEEQNPGRWWYLLTLGSRDAMGSKTPHKPVLTHSKASVVLRSEASSENKR